MLIKTLCLGPAPDAPATGLLRDAVARLRRETRGLQQVQALRALRHIPSDSVNQGTGYTGVTAEADGIGCVLELYFDDARAAAAATASPAWTAFTEQVRAAAPVLFSFDSQPNIPVTPRGAAVQGGFRRWMLLARKAETQDAFRDAWFGRHASLLRAMPHVDGYLQNLVTRRFDAQGREVGYDTLPVDGIAEICYADEAAMNASYTSEARLPLRDDGRRPAGPDHHHPGAGGDTRMTDRIGFIGLGDIGAPMARRIEQEGHPLRVFNRSAAKAQPFAARAFRSQLRSRNWRASATSSSPA
jgi:hypothetical protein